MAEKWDCYSPVAMVLWRAADFAEAGVTTPCRHAISDLGDYGEMWDLAVDYSDSLYQISGTTFPLPPAAWAVALRQLAEFGPEGKGRAV